MKFAQLFLRLALGAGFLSASADRFGLWKENVAWGNWANFVDYTGQLVPFLSDSMTNVAAIIATALEIIFGIALILGWKTKIFALLSGILLLIFAFSMAFTLGIKAPLDFSVFSASAGAFLLSTLSPGFLEIDILLNKRKKRIYRY